MAQVSLFKKSGKYKDKDGNEKSFTNFYVRCGDALIPVEVCYFPNKETNRDNQYSGRKEVLKAFAETLPELPSNGNSDKPSEVPNETLQPLSDSTSTPF